MVKIESKKQNLHEVELSSVRRRITRDVSLALLYEGLIVICSAEGCGLIADTINLRDDLRASPWSSHLDMYFTKSASTHCRSKYHISDTALFLTI